MAVMAYYNKILWHWILNFFTLVRTTNNKIFEININNITTHYHIIDNHIHGIYNTKIKNMEQKT